MGVEMERDREKEGKHTGIEGGSLARTTESERERGTERERNGESGFKGGGRRADEE